MDEIPVDWAQEASGLDGRMMKELKNGSKLKHVECNGRSAPRVPSGQYLRVQSSGKRMDRKDFCVFVNISL